MTCKRKAQRLMGSLQLPEGPPRSIPSLAFIWWALGLALTAGFAQGMTLFALLALGLPTGPWWTAAAQAHGHVQLYGWAGMFALGVGLHFLPRLRGCPNPSVRAVRAAAWLLGGGLALRAISQPLMAAFEARELFTLSRIGLVTSGALELAGAGAAVMALVVVALKGPPLTTRAGLVAVLPFALSFFVALLAGLTANLVVLVDGALARRALVPASVSWELSHLGLIGMLVPISAAISARTFPLYLHLRVPPARELYAAFAILLLGFLLRAFQPLDLPFMPAWLPPLGALLEGVAMLALVVVLDVPLRWTRRTPLGEAMPLPPEHRAAAWLILSAYLWLAVAGLILVAEAVGGWGLIPALPQDAERHALGTGFVTLLILGMAVRLLPGFAGRRLGSALLVWVTVWLGNAAALLRVGPLLFVASPASVGLLALSGVLAFAAVGSLAWNLLQTLLWPSIGNDVEQSETLTRSMGTHRHSPISSPAR